MSDATKLNEEQSRAREIERTNHRRALSDLQKELETERAEHQADVDSYKKASDDLLARYRELAQIDRVAEKSGLDAGHVLENAYLAERDVQHYMKRHDIEEVTENLLAEIIVGCPLALLSPSVAHVLMRVRSRGVAAKKLPNRKVPQVLRDIEIAVSHALGGHTRPLGEKGYTPKMKKEWLRHQRDSAARIYREKRAAGMPADEAALAARSKVLDAFPAVDASDAAECRANGALIKHASRTSHDKKKQR